MIRQYMRALLGALAAVHDAGMVHRDVKASNFLFSRQLGVGWLIDFGLVDVPPPPSRARKSTAVATTARGTVRACSACLMCSSRSTGLRTRVQAAALVCVCTVALSTC
jgi:serine/threonine protein kinase